tara:strand:- start:1347 stop:1448 length:102 start_codon:yes stop_codon:yes gene_type:complete
MKEELLNRIKEQIELENLYYAILGVTHGANNIE